MNLYPCVVASQIDSGLGNVTLYGYWDISKVTQAEAWKVLVHWTLPSRLVESNRRVKKQGTVHLMNMAHLPQTS